MTIFMLVISANKKTLQEIKNLDWVFSVSYLVLFQKYSKTRDYGIN